MNLITHKELLTQLDYNPSTGIFIRLISKQCNLRNTGNPKTNTSGVKGISYSNQNNKWQAAIFVNKNSIHLGFYKEFDNAVCARLAGEQCLDWSGCDSYSPAYQYVQKYILNKDTFV